MADAVGDGELLAVGLGVKDGVAVSVAATGERVAVAVAVAVLFATDVAVAVAVGGTSDLVGVNVGGIVAVGDLVGGSAVKVAEGTAVDVRVGVATGRGVRVGEFMIVT